MCYIYLIVNLDEQAICFDYTFVLPYKILFLYRNTFVRCTMLTTFLNFLRPKIYLLIY